MKPFALTIVLLVVAWSTTPVFAQSGSTILYSANKYGKEEFQTPRLIYCLDFMKGPSDKRSDPCDLRYGSLYVGDDWDWFQSSGHRDSRSLIKDLGPLSWNLKIKVPVITPLPKLLAGQQRTITVDASGADGADGAPGAPGKPGTDADAPHIDEQAFPRPSASPTANSSNPTSNTNKKHDGVPKVDPMFVKAILGHMYAIRVVDDKNDFYALFRVDEIKRGDFVVVSWKIAEAPAEPVKKR
jgi:hypothetical protein